MNWFIYIGGGGLFTEFVELLYCFACLKCKRKWKTEYAISVFFFSLITLGMVMLEAYQIISGT